MDAAYSRAFDYDAQSYWESGTKLAALSSASGYSYARTGTQGADDADGTVDWFADNVPAINGKGYHAYGALTNEVSRSQELELWGTTAFGAGDSITANQAAAPDGTMTAERLAEGTGGSAPIISSLTTMSSTLGDKITLAICARNNAGARRLYLADQLTENGGCFATFDLANGTSQVTAGSCSGVSYIIPLINGWYVCVLTYTAHLTTSGFSMKTGMVNGHNNSAYTADSTGKFDIWQAQWLRASLPNGGPYIATGAATAVIGAGVLATNAAPPDQASLFFCPAIVWDNAGGNNFHCDFSDGTDNNRIAIYRSGANYSCLVNVGGVAQLSASIAAPAIGAEGCPVLLRSGGNWRFGKVVGGVLTWAAAASAGTFPVTSTVHHASARDGSSQLGGQLKGLFLKPMSGTADADVLAAVAETG